jgi:hypothetical protein
VKTNIRAVEKLDLATEVRNRKNKSASACRCIADAEVRLGELFNGLEKKQGETKYRGSTKLEIHP